MLANNAEILAGSPPSREGKVRFLTLQGLDGRTVAAKRARELAQCFEAELGGALTATQRVAVERAAPLTAIAEDAKARRLSGDMAITLEDVVRTDNAARRAVKELGLGTKSASATPPPSLSAWAQAPAPPEAQAHRQPLDEPGDPSAGDATP